MSEKRSRDVKRDDGERTITICLPAKVLEEVDQLVDLLVFDAIDPIGSEALPDRLDRSTVIAMLLQEALEEWAKLWQRGEKPWRRR